MSGTTDTVCDTSASGSTNTVANTIASVIVIPLNSRSRPGRGRARSTAWRSFSMAAIISASPSDSSRVSPGSPSGAKMAGLSPGFSGRPRPGSNGAVLLIFVIVSVASPMDTKTSRRWSSAVGRHRPVASSLWYSRKAVILSSGLLCLGFGTVPQDIPGGKRPVAVDQPRSAAVFRRTNFWIFPVEVLGSS